MGNRTYKYTLEENYAENILRHGWGIGRFTWKYQEASWYD